MKKLLLGLGTLSLVASPVLVVVSCSSKTKTITIKGSLNTRAVSTADMKTTIAAIKVYQAEELITPGSGNKDALIFALNLWTFTGLEISDVDNFVISYTEIPGSETITLTTNTGFEFGTGTSLVSKINSDVIQGSLNSGAVITDDIKTTIRAIENYEGSSKADGDKDTLIAALNLKSFTGLVVADVPNFVITYNKTPGSETITLTAKPGFKFGTGTSLVSKINSDVIPGAINSTVVITDDIKTTIRAIENYEGISSPNNTQKIILINALNKTSFTGLLASDVDKFVITYNKTPGSETITLTAKPGFIFGAGALLVSKFFVLMSGSLNTGEVTILDQKTTIRAIENYEGSSKADGDKDTLIAALNLKSFTGLVVADVPNFVITYNKTPGSETITLTPNAGFEFGANTLLVSTINMVVIPGAINRGEVTAVNMKTTIEAIKIYKAEELITPGSGNKDALIFALNLWTFTNLVVADVPNFVITYTETFGNETITLTTNTGFRFGTGTLLVKGINVVAIPGSLNIGEVTTAEMKTTIEAIEVYEVISSPNNTQKTILINALNKTSFTGLLAADVDKFVITYIETPGSETITLTPKTGFKFEGWTTLVSRINIIPGAINSGVVNTDNMKTTIEAIKIYKAISKPTVGNKNTLIAALNAASFTSLVSVYVPNFVITYTETSGNETITLTTNTGFKFGTGTSLVSKINSDAIQGSLKNGAVTTADMKITIAAIKIYEVISKPTADDKDTLIAALNLKSFTGLVVADVDNFVISYDDTIGSETITLTAKPRFSFGTGDTLVSIIVVVIPGSLKIGEVTSDDMKTTIEAIKVYQAEELITPGSGNKTVLITALNLKSFTGLEVADVDKFVISYDETPGSETITLTPKTGFKFGTNTSLVSTINMVVIPGSLKIGEVTSDDMKTTIEAIKVYQAEELITPGSGNKTVLITALNLKSFTGLEVAYLDNFLISYTDDNESETITLTAKPGFVFATGTLLVSKIVVLMPGASEGPTIQSNMTWLQQEIGIYEGSSKDQAAKNKVIGSLNDVQFSGLLAADIDNFDFKNVGNTVVITAKIGFVFATGTTLISNVR